MRSELAKCLLHAQTRSMQKSTDQSDDDGCHEALNE